MKMSSRQKRNSILCLFATLFLLLFFQNCSNGFNSSGLASGSMDSTSGSPNPSPSPAPGAGPSPAPVPLPIPAPLPAPIPFGATITNLKIQNTADSEQINVPVTFAQVFVMGAIAKTDQLAGKLQDGTVLPLQVEVKATHSDGSVRHALISLVLPKLENGQIQTLSILKASANAPSNAAGLTAAALVEAGLTARISAKLDGQVYSATAESLLKGPKIISWISGPIANEWVVSGPLKTSTGTEHPHLTARFAIRGYAGLAKARIDVTLENNWAYEPNPQNLTYDAEISVEGESVYSKAGLNHFRQARWRKIFWWGNEPQTHLVHDTSYLISTRAVPNYDPSVQISEASLASLKTSFTGTKAEPMGPGLAVPYMPATGGRPDIGILPGWAVSYLLTMDPRAKTSTFGTADLAGSFPMHYRDKITDRPISLLDFPYMTLLGNPGDTYNPATKKYESFPACSGSCQTSNIADTSHAPNLAYLPYLVTGDFYYLEELQFWASFSAFASNPHYRGFEKGWLKSDQLRGQGWSLRTLADAAYISPDTDPLKSVFTTIVDSNLDWYNENYTNNPNANALGVIIHGYTVVYTMGAPSTGLAPWQDDFFTQALGHVAELGFTKAQNLLRWKAKFQISRLTDPNYCWIDAAVYSLKVRDSETSPIYATIGQAHQATFDSAYRSLPCGGTEMASHWKLKIGEMTGYSYSNSGYPSNLQPALAYAVSSGAANGPAAWQVFINRNVKPDYENGAQFAIVPRQQVKGGNR